MNQITSSGIIGAGAIGAPLSLRLQRTYGDSSVLIADEDRARRYLKEGLLINSERFTPVMAVRQEPIDLLIICVKYAQFSQALELIDPYVGKHTQIISLLNGITTEDILIERYGREKVLYAFAVGQDSVRSGSSISYTNSGRIVLGEARNEPGNRSPRCESVADYLHQAGVEVVVPEDMIHELWWKFMVNVGVNQVSALYGATYGMIREDPKLFDLMRQLTEEIITLSSITDSPLSEKDFDRWVSVLATLDSNGKTSMLQDVEAGRPTELDLFGKTACELAHRARIPLPVNEQVYQELRRRTTG